MAPLNNSNIWVAAGDGNLPRVRELIDNQSLSPNIPDSFTYTPMHAAASYGQLEVLDYLMSRGGDVNVIDDDGDTPLYTVENIETARFLVEHGATINRRNIHGISPIEHLNEDFPTVAHYLQSLTSSVPVPIPSTQPSQYQQTIATEQLTSELMTSVQDIMQRAEAEGRDPEEELRQVVGRTVVEGVVTGFQMTTDNDDAREVDRVQGINGTPMKRSKVDDSRRSE